MYWLNECFANAEDHIAGNGGYLWADDMQFMNLSSVHLAVLSACNTGRGSLSADGVAGLSRLYFYLFVGVCSSGRGCLYLNNSGLS